MSKSSTSVTIKVLKLDDKVKAINIGDGGQRCQAVAEEMGDGRTQIMKIRFIWNMKLCRFIYGLEVGKLHVTSFKDKM